MVGAELDLASKSEGMSGWDKRLLEAASRRSGRISPIELSKLAGGTPEKCAQRLKELLADRDWLSNLERQALVLEDLVDLKDHLLGMVRDDSFGWTDERGRWRGADPRWSAELLKVIKEISRQNEIGFKQIEGAKAGLRQAYANLMIRSIEMATMEMLGAIADEQSIDTEPYRQRLVEEFLPRAFEVIQQAATPAEDEQDAA